MNAGIERGFVAIVHSRIVGVPVREATSSQPLPADTQMVIVECPECEHVAGPLYRATVRVFLGSPAFDLEEARHREVAGSLARVFGDGNGAKAIFDATENSLSLHGIHIRSQSEEVVENAWRSTIELIVGIHLG